MYSTEKTETNIRHSIRFKIFLVSLLPTIALLAAAILNNQYLTALGDSAENILSKNYNSIRAAQDARKTLEKTRNLMLEQISKQKNITTIPQPTISHLSASLKFCQNNVTEIGEQDLIDQLIRLFGQYEPLVQELKEKYVETLSSDLFSQFLEITAEMVKSLDDLVAINENAMEKAEKQTRLLAGRAQQQAEILFGIIIIAILTLSYLLSYRIARPIMTLARKISNIEEGKGDYPNIPSQTNDEIGFLTTSFNRLFSRLKQYDHHRDEIIASEKEKVRQREEAKGRFIADISHQLKTPMTSLSMSVGMLYARGETLGAEKKARLYSTAYDDCTRLTTLINELVDISRLETMSQPRPKENLDIKLVIDECLTPLIKQAENKGISIEVNLPKDLPPITIDSFRFPWVITNLVGNALRYTNSGGRIELNAYLQDTRFYFRFSDTGTGIDPQYLPHIFDRFTQFSERGKSGTVGLGLAIVKDIIEQHGGDIWVESQKGQGTIFTFWIPAPVEERK